MSDVQQVILAACLGGVVAVVALFLSLTAWEHARSWRYKRSEYQKYRERPKIPYQVRSIELTAYDGYWGATCLDRQGKRLGHDTDTHPMDAVKNALTAREQLDAATTDTAADRGEGEE